MCYEDRGANEIAHEDTWTLGVSYIIWMQGPAERRDHLTRCLRSIFAMLLGSPVALKHLSSRSVAFGNCYRVRRMRCSCGWGQGGVSGRWHPSSIQSLRTSRILPTSRTAPGINEIKRSCYKRVCDEWEWKLRGWECDLKCEVWIKWGWNQASLGRGDWSAVTEMRQLCSPSFFLRLGRLRDIEYGASFTELLAWAGGSRTAQLA